MPQKETTPIVSVLFGYAPTPLKAAQIADTYRHCPYCVSYKSSGRSATGVFSIPSDHRWWLQWVVDDPQKTVGFKSAALFFPQEVTALSPWARGEVRPEQDLSPCKANCRECPKYGDVCEGCPATNYFLNTPGRK